MTNPVWLTLDDLAARLGVPVRTLRLWRTQGTGPTGVIMGKHLRYALVDVEAWETEQRKASLRSTLDRASKAKAA